MRQQIRDAILARSGLAAQHARRVVEEPRPSLDFVREQVYLYICCKFLLEPEQCRGLTMAGLAQRSIEKALDLGLPLAKESETATTCGAAGSAAMKTALLLTAVKRDFQADIPPRELGLVRSPGELGELVWRARGGDRT